ncbi:hypothetical protein [Draconibacterium sediminis]|uniref:Uncharacterized protein n=1 Tax=Draconibacterium sediminis TaxID=1544798 RepID=A0A0D8JGZ4_9BACT|nr:hypothetical protein [Draconibacterium sediminis]KJF45128.1 hypothetical protein LH29_06920 [Draconibacterium sediminis]
MNNTIVLAKYYINPFHLGVMPLGFKNCLNCLQKGMLSKLKGGIWAKKCHLSQAATIILAQKWHLPHMKGNVYWRKCYLLHAKGSVFSRKWSLRNVQR